MFLVSAVAMVTWSAYVCDDERGVWGVESTAGKGRLVRGLGGEVC
jgi:hypothetical protein